MLPSHQATVPSFKDDELSNDDKTLDDSQVHKVRGETRMIVVWNLKEGEWIPTRFNDNGQPLGDKGDIFNKFMSYVAHVPNQILLDAMDWRKIPIAIKENCWSIMTRRFTILKPPLGDIVKRWFIKDLREK